MKAKWILLVATLVVAVGCDLPDVKKYEFKPPVIKDPTLPELDKLIAEINSNMECEDSRGQIAIKGPLHKRDERLEIKGDYQFQWARSKATDLKFSEQERGLLNLGCSEDFIKLHNTENMQVRNHVAGEDLIANKVLLCGTQLGLSQLLVIAETTVMNEFVFASDSGLATIGTGTLVLVGKSSIVKTTVSYGSEDSKTSGIDLLIYTGLRGEGKLNLSASLTQCKFNSSKSAP